MEILSPRTGHASNATHTGIEMLMTAASRASSHSNANPRKAIHPLIVSSDTSTSRSRMSGGTRTPCPRTMAISANAAAPTNPHNPREESGGHSLKRCFMIGKFSPHPIEATARKRRPSGEIRARPVVETAGMDALEFRVRYVCQYWHTATGKLPRRNSPRPRRGASSFAYLATPIHAPRREATADTIRLGT